MSTYTWNEHFEAQEVTYILELGDEIIVVEHVPARVNVETGERLFAPETVVRLQAIVQSRPAPQRVLRAPVFDFAA
ncbi:hypothetical protein EYB53_015900 [Candidatus Chloroploca sp. M-50]|uniref:YgiT-type zinc finger domain-containing protein n=2 Tax=Candidatus Chloroploca TaxID=1579476 RepID=A0A2H3L7Z6_9CHLR|nr:MULTISPECIES: hypothetical protein [Candidatus Chloroploca]MBP1467198.1 hypothetical protein [Candidatus Chloroploca mongolica]PDW01360.1 hypothetical protein A9Q02_21000 [Candidatus Chloroploca asiatica]